MVRWIEFVVFFSPISVNRMKLLGRSPLLNEKRFQKDVYVRISQFKFVHSMNISAEDSAKLQRLMGCGPEKILRQSKCSLAKLLIDKVSFDNVL